MKYLIVAAHPDDEVLGCGASISKWTQMGNEVHIIIVAEGATSRDFIRDTTKRKNDLNKLKKSAQNASKIMGVKSLNFLGFPDNRMDSVDLLDVIKPIENYIFDYQPDCLVTHHYGDLNIDHQIIHKAVITACRPQPNFCVKRIMSFEVPSSTDYQISNHVNSFYPNWYEDVSDFMKFKLSALNEYDSEMRQWPHSRSLENVECLARNRGSNVGIAFAEAFSLLRFIN